MQDQRWEAVTLRQLATHTAGIPNLPPSLNSVQLTEHGIDPFADYDKARLYQDIPETKVGSNGKWEYSNYGYALLGLVLSQQTSVDYAKLVKQRIFEPLRMENATIEGWSSTNIAPPLDSNGGSSNHWNFKAFESAGALRGNILDGIIFSKLPWPRVRITTQFHAQIVTRNSLLIFKYIATAKWALGGIELRMVIT